MTERVSTLPPAQSRAQALVRHVERLIADRGLSAGALIGTKSEIRGSVNVSRATVNEAVRLLEARGVVTARPGPGGGLFVAAQDPVIRLGQSLLSVRDEPVLVADAVIVRELLEPRIVLDAAQHRTPSDIAALTDRTDALADFVDDPDAFLHAVWELHRVIAGITPNRVLRDTYLSMLAFVAAETTSVHPSGDQAAHREYKRGRLRVHQDLTRAIVSGDLGAAAAAAAAHELATAR